MDKDELRDYINNVVGRFSWKKRFLVIYDQLNPAYAKYYSGSETQALWKTMVLPTYVSIAAMAIAGLSWALNGEQGLQPAPVPLGDAPSGK
jgi:hypothetical protein